MKIKVVINTYDPDVINACDKLGSKRNRFVEAALMHFLNSRKGKETLRFMLEQGRKEKPVKGPMKEKPIKRPPAENERDNGPVKKIDFDKFL